MTEDVPLERQAEVAKGFLEGLLAEFGQQAAVAVHPIDEDTVEVRVTGDDLGLLIGPKGQTLQAIQELARTVVQRQTGAHNGRLIVDVAGYRQARREALARFTHEVAGKVVESGQAVGARQVHSLRAYPARSRQAFSFSRPRRTHDFTVPSGSCRSVANSECDMPW